MSLASNVLDVIWFLGHLSSHWPPSPHTHIVTNLLSGAGCALATPRFPPNWHIGMKDSGYGEHPYAPLRTQAPGLPKCVLTPAIGIKKATLRCS